MFCSQCGTSVPEGKRFCPVCGYPIDQIASHSEAGRTNVGFTENERLVKLEREQAEALKAERERVLESRNAEVTPVAQMLGDGRLAYDEVSVAGSVASSKDEKTELKEAKVAYKQARKAAGKSAVPKVVAVIVAIIVAAGAGAGAMWWFSGQQSGSVPTQSSSALSASENVSSTDEASEGASSDAPLSSSAGAADLSGSSSTSAQGGIESYVGTWEGRMVEPTHYAFVACCYGADDYPLVLEVKKVGATGRITADAHVLFHEHEDLKGADAASTEGDTYLELNDLVGTLSNDGTFRFRDELAERGEYEEVTITAKTVDAPDGKRTLEVAVDSQVLGGYATDLYVLEKQ